MKRAARAIGRCLWWLGLTGTLLICAIWISTGFGEPWACDRKSIYISAVAGQIFLISDGQLNYDSAAYERDNGYYQKPKTGRFMAGFKPPSKYWKRSFWDRMHVGRWWPESINVGGLARPQYYIFIPIWMPLVVSAGTAAVGWRLRGRKPRPGQCGHCGYNLTGLTGGPCPECGRAPGTPGQTRTPPPPT